MTGRLFPNPSATVLTLIFMTVFVWGGCTASDQSEGEANRFVDVAVCAVAVDNRCATDENEFVVQNSRIYVSATVEEAVPGTEAVATLTRIEEGSRERLLSYAVVIDPMEDADTDALLFFFDSGGPEDGQWPAGDYEIEVAVEAAGSDPVTKAIRIR